MPSPAAPAVSVKDRILKFADDVTTLDVLTLTGNVDLAGTPGVAVPAGDLSALFTAVTSKLVIDNAKISIVAYTHSEWDGDSVVFSAKGAEPGLLEAHNATVIAAHKARYEAIAVIAKSLWDKLA